MNFRDYTCRSSPFIEDLIPPILYDKKRCIPFYGNEMEENKGYEEYVPYYQIKPDTPNKGFEEWVTSLTLTKDAILRTIEVLKNKYGNDTEYVDFFKIARGGHRKVSEQYMHYNELCNFEKVFLDSNNQQWNKPRNVKHPETNSKIVSLLTCNLESKLKHEEYNVAWCFRICRLYRLKYLIIPCSHRICREATLYIYEPNEEHLTAPITFYRYSKPWFA